MNLCFQFLTLLKSKTFIFISFIVFLLNSCSNETFKNTNLNLYVHDEVKLNFLIYMAGDNNLERFGIQNIKALQEIGSPESCNILVLFDRSGGYDRTEENWSNTKLFLISKNPENMNDDCIYNFEEMDMTSVNSLYDFLDLTNKYFPAKHTVLDLWSHGRGVYPDGKIGRSIIEDYTTGYGADTMMSVCNLAECIKKYEKNNNKKIDIILFDACYMQMIEICYQLKDLCDYVIGAETSIPGVGYNYKNIATYLNASDFTIKEIASFLANATSSASVDYSYSSIDTSFLDDFVIEFNKFCKELLEYPYYEVIEKRLSMKNITSVYPEFVDLYEFIFYFSETDGQSELLNVLDKLIINTNSIGAFEDKTKGLSINFPYDESEIVFYKAVNEYYEQLDFYEDSCFDEFLLQIWQNLEN